jgi:hypothetical protein
MVPQANT